MSRAFFLITASALIQMNAWAQPAFPLSDPDNTGGWMLNTEISDEFENAPLDAAKWFIQGTDNQFHKWQGRAPSQFAPHNVKVEDGKLKLTSQWEPDFAFSDQKMDGRNYENITTAGVISHRKFLYGYFEIKSKAADAAMTSSFWTLGYQSELDMFEQMGRPTLLQKAGFTNSYMFSIHDWRPGIVAGENKIFTRIHKLDYGVADDFHVYGCEWGEDYLKFFEDGNLVYETTQKELGDAWILTNPLEVWFDSETFPWFGLPEAEDLPVDFEIEYVRIWQKPNANLLDRPAFGFEGPWIEDLDIPARNTAQQKTWFFSDASKPFMRITDAWFSSGRKSLKFAHTGSVSTDAIAAMSPYGSAQLPAGNYTLSMNVWIAPESTVTTLRPILEQPWLQLNPIDLTEVERGKWLTISQPFTRTEISGEKDRLRLVVGKDDIPNGSSIVYIDEISITPVQ